MKSGSALTWAEQKLTEYATANWAQTWVQFLVDLRTSSGDVSRKKIGHICIHELKQTGSVANYNVTFMALHQLAGFNDEESGRKDWRHPYFEKSTMKLPSLQTSLLGVLVLLITIALTENSNRDLLPTKPLPLPPPKLVTFLSLRPLHHLNHLQLPPPLLQSELNKNALILPLPRSEKKKDNAFFVVVQIIGRIFVPNKSLCPSSLLIRHQDVVVVNGRIKELDPLAPSIALTKWKLWRTRTLVGRLRLQTGKAPSHLSYLF